MESLDHNLKTFISASMLQHGTSAPSTPPGPCRLLFVCVHICFFVCARRSFAWTLQPGSVSPCAPPGKPRI